MVAVEQMLKETIARDVLDIFLVAGHPYAFKVSGEIHSMQETRLMPNNTAQLIQGVYQYALQNTYEDFPRKKDGDLSFSIPDVGRFHYNVYLQRDSQTTVLRAVRFEPPDPVESGIPQAITSLTAVKKGMILVSGPAGCGKSTTLACIIDRINESHNVHIVTVEDPIEYLHTHKKGVVSQREVYHSIQDYLDTLYSALREAPKIILAEKMRDLKTIDTAVTATETGRLVSSTLHTMGVANIIDRVIDVFPDEQQQQIRVQLSMTLHTVISEQPMPVTDGGIILVFEITIASPAVRTQIREGEIHQLEDFMIAGRDQGMMTTDESLMKLYEESRINKGAALTYANNSEHMHKKLNV